MDSKTGELLREVFPRDTRFASDEYLKWLYRHSPSGSVIESNSDVDSRRVGHYALVPQRWIWNQEIRRVGLSLNTAVSLTARRSGLFSELAEQSYAKANSLGINTIIGVSNAASTPGFVRKLKFSSFGPLPVSLYLNRYKGRSEKVVLSEKLKILTILDSHNQLLMNNYPEMCCRYWDFDELAWRLSCPTSEFELLLVENSLVVATRVTFRGFPLGVIAKLFSRGLHRISLARVASAVNSRYKTVAAIYCGFSPFVSPGGLRIPDRLRPSPLNLIIRNDNGMTSVDQPQVGCIEFLDFDAY